MRASQKIEELGEALREATREDVSQHHHLLQRSRFLHAIDGARRPRSRFLVVGLAASLALTLAVLGFVGRKHTLDFSSQTDAATGGTRWSFSDGSEVDLAPGAAAKVVLLQDGGARIDLARGHLDVYVNPKRHARWEVLAGSHTVTVTGTRFLVERGQGTEVTVQVNEGRVLVRDPSMTEPVVLDEPGERYTTVPAPRPAPPHPTARREPEPPRSLDPPRSFEEELLDAERARLSGERKLAEKLLLNLRSRHGTGAKGAQVAYRLGRLLEYEHPQKAAAWYAAVFKEQPDGPLARDAANAIVDKFPESSQAAAAKRFLAAH
ncbi:MAG: FecR domain-containing protein [Myxococcota bacterium]